MKVVRTHLYGYWGLRKGFWIFKKYFNFKTQQWMPESDYLENKQNYLFNSKRNRFVGCDSWKVTKDYTYQMQEKHSYYNESFREASEEAVESMFENIGALIDREIKSIENKTDLKITHKGTGEKDIFNLTFKISWLTGEEQTSEHQNEEGDHDD